MLCVAVEWFCCVIVVHGIIFVPPITILPFPLPSQTFTVPAQCQSAITIESYKKYICVCLLVRGEVPPPPRFGGSSALFRDLKSICAAYLDLER